MTSTLPCPSPKPLEIPGFRKLWSGGLLSLVGTHMQFVALPFFVFDMTGSTFATAVTAAGQAIPAMFLGPLAGALADLRDTRRVLITANALLCLVTLAFCLSPLAPWWVMVLIAFLQAVLGQLVEPAEVVMVVSLVPAQRLPAANSMLGANVSLARLVGPTAGGALYAVAGLPAVAVLNAISFAAAGVLVSQIQRVDARPAQPVLVPRPRLTSGWTEGWTAIGKQPMLRALLVVSALTGLGEGCVSALIAPYVGEVFGGSSALGLLMSCQAVGGLIGALVMIRMTRPDLMPRTLGWAAVSGGLLLSVMITYPLFYPPLYPALMLITAAGLPFAAVAAARLTLLQTLTEPTSRGRVFGVFSGITGTVQLSGILLSGYLADRTTVYLLLIDSPCYLLAGVVMLRRSGRQRSG
ncbi:MFS family permease [Nakamurella sp. UYEF19]|uniref:MFS transporter n=1 Tax=Nakamurella sp. UYEF19 TaxID=1756392 RepID=UPI0033993F34